MKGKVLVPLLNVRSTPSKEYDKIAMVKQDDVLEIVDFSQDWMQIVYDGDLAYVMSKYVEVLKRTGIVTAAGLNVREQPGGQVLGVVKRGQKVDILDERNGWLEIGYKGDSAFVSAKYIKDEGDTTHYEDEEEEDIQLYLYKDATLKKVALEPKNKLDGPSNKAPRHERIPKQIWNQYGNLLTALGDKMDIEVAAAVAVLSVESGGSGFGKNGKMLIRFENHWFYNLFGKKNKDDFDKYFRFDPSAKWKGHEFRPSTSSDWIDFHGKQDLEWEALETARQLDSDAALKSISMGAPQIMGFNFKKIGYSSVQEMFDNFNKDIRYHIFALFDFFNESMIQALKKKDFITFARGYNGPAQANQYGEWIQQFYKAFPKIT